MNAYAQIADLLGALIPIFAAFAYRHPLQAMARGFGSKAKLLGERFQRYWQHELAVHLRRVLLFVALPINVLMMGAVYFCLITWAHPKGFGWFWVWLAVFVLSVVALAIPIAMLWGVNGYTSIERAFIYGGPFARKAPAGGAAATTRLRQMLAYARRLREIERRVGPPSRHNALAFLGLVLSFFISSFGLWLLAGELYTAQAVSQPYVYLPIAFGIAFLLMAVGTLGAAAVAMAALIDKVGGFAAQMLGILIRIVLTMGPFITRENWREWFGEKQASPSLTASRKGMVKPYVGGLALLGAVYFCVPHPLFVLIVFPVLLVVLKLTEIALSWAFEEETSKKLLAALVKLLMAVLVFYRLITLAGMIFWGWPKDIDRRIFRFLWGWSDLFLQVDAWYGILVVVLCGALAGFFFWVSKKVSNHAAKAGSTVLGVLLGAIVFVTMMGWVATWATGEDKPTLDRLLSVGSPSSTVQSRTPTVNNLNVSVTNPPAPAVTPPLRGGNAGMRDDDDNHPPRHARVRTARRDPCEGLQESFRHTRVGRQRCR